MDSQLKEKVSDNVIMKFHPDNIIDLIVRPFKMRFSDADEHAFRYEQNHEMRKHLLHVFAGILILCTVLYFLDATVPNRLTLLVSFGLVSAGFLLVAIPGDSRHRQLLVSGGSTVVQLIVFWTIFRTHDPGKVTASHNFLVPFIFVHYMMLRLTFIPALLSGAIALAGLLFLVVVSQVPNQGEAIQAVVVANVLGLFGAQRLEVMRRMNFKAIRDIRNEQTKTQRLVHRIIPQTLVERILGAPEKNVDFFNQVSGCSILFVGLTNCGMADKRDLFRIFDAIISRASIEKIKTAENLLIAAGGLFDNDPAAEEILNVAIRMRHEVTQYNLDHKLAVSFSAGIAYGRVSCGIIGAKVFAFDIWGMPVNLASRILQTSAIGGICVSREFVGLLHEGYQFASIGRHDLKGIGYTEVFEFEKLCFAERFQLKEAT